MKYFLCPLLLFALNPAVYSQSQSLRTEEYCEVDVEPVFGSPFCHIRIDFGQPPRRGLVSSVDKLRDPITQRPIEFNSAMDALNYMNEQGWELVQIYNGDSCDTRYVMRRVIVEATYYEPSTPR